MNNMYRVINFAYHSLSISHRKSNSTVQVLLPIKSRYMTLECCILVLSNDLIDNFSFLFKIRCYVHIIVIQIRKPR